MIKLWIYTANAVSVAQTFHAASPRLKPEFCFPCFLFTTVVGFFTGSAELVLVVYPPLAKPPHI